MSKKGSHNRREKERSLRPVQPKHSVPRAEMPELVPRRERASEIRKRFLILCEGETEQAYFEGITNNPLLKNLLSGVEVQVVTLTHNSDRFDPERHLTDNSLQGLVWEAMQRKKAAQKFKNPYDEIWIVMDDDSRDILLKKYASPTALFFENEVFVYGQERVDKSQIPKEQDFDHEWKHYVKMAYSCRSFEVYLLLHFEQNSNAHISEEDSKAKIRVYSPFFDKGSLNKKYPDTSEKKSRANAYEMLKPQPLFNLKYEKEDDAQAILDKIATASENAVWLRDYQAANVEANAGFFFGVNPYTMVDQLTNALLDREKIMFTELNQNILIEASQFEFQLDAAQYQFIILINISPTQRIILNNANIGLYIWAQLKTNHRIEKILPTGLISNALNLPDFAGNTIGRALIQFQPLNFYAEEVSLHFRFGKKEMIIRTQ